MNYGIFGTILISIHLTVSTFKYCSKCEIPNSEKECKLNDTDIFKYICKVNKTTKENHTNYTNYYFDNFIIDKFYWSELLIIILGMIVFIFIQCFSIIIIKNLSPSHLIFSFPIYYFVEKLISASYTMIKKESFFWFENEINNNNNYNNNKIKIAKYILDSSGDIQYL